MSKVDDSGTGTYRVGIAMSAPPTADNGPSAKREGPSRLKKCKRWQGMTGLQTGRRAFSGNPPSRGGLRRVCGRPARREPANPSLGANAPLQSRPIPPRAFANPSQAAISPGKTYVRHLRALQTRRCPPLAGGKRSAGAAGRGARGRAPRGPAGGPPEGANPRGRKRGAGPRWPGPACTVSGQSAPSRALAPDATSGSPARRLA